MILCIGDVLNPTELGTVLSKLETAAAAAEFVDGKQTAGWHAKLVKHNTQLSNQSAVAETVKATIMQAIQRNVLFQMAVYPQVVRSPLLSRYEVGMSYGNHIDNALMGETERMRSDVSLTLFLSSPESYGGGELVIETTQGTQGFKLAAGAMVLYPSSTLHRVEPVTDGVRLVAVTWVQSLVRTESDREILFDLDTARRSIFDKYGKTTEFDLLSKSHANLLRKWAEI